MPLISTRIHGVLDYASVVILLAVPRLLGWSDGVTLLLTVLGLGTLVYSLLTRYELSPFRVLSMKAHLTLDFLSGVALIGAALILWPEPVGVRVALGLFGAFEVFAALSTDPLPSRVGDPERRERIAGF